MTQTTEISIRPATIFAFLKVIPMAMLSPVFVYLAWCLSPFFLTFSFFLTGMAWYRFLYIRNIRYEIGPEIIYVRQGIFYKRTDLVELFRVKDYIVTQPFLHRVFHLMDITLKSTDVETPTIWLRGIPESDLIKIIREHVQQARARNRIYEIN